MQNLINKFLALPKHKQLILVAGANMAQATYNFIEFNENFNASENVSASDIENEGYNFSVTTYSDMLVKLYQGEATSELANEFVNEAICLVDGCELSDYENESDINVALRELVKFFE